MEAKVIAVRPDLVDLAREVVGEDPFGRVNDGTRFQQPAIFCAALAGWECLRGLELEPAALAGHSLGEIVALTAAGALEESDALRLVAARGRLMQEAGDSSGETGMLAVRTSRDRIEGLSNTLGLTLANDNAPEQVVIAGPLDALGHAAERLRGDGIRSVRLPVAGAFHSPAMDSAADGLAAEVAAIGIRTPRIPVYSCLTAAPFDDIAAGLVDGLTRPVHWLDTMRAMQADGIDRFVETGPGKVLTGLVRKSLKGVEALTAADLKAAYA